MPVNVGNYVDYDNVSYDYIETFFKKQGDVFQAIQGKIQKQLENINSEVKETQNKTNQLDKNLTEDKLVEWIIQSFDSEDDSDLLNKYAELIDKMKILLKEVNERGNQFETLTKTYGEFKNLYDQIKKTKTGIVVDWTELDREMSKIDPNKATEKLKEIGNILGKLGEIYGSMKMYQISERLLKKHFQDYPGYSIEILNTGSLKTSNASKATSDTIVAIKDANNEIKCSIGISDKINARFTLKAKNTGTAIKMSTSTIDNLLKTVDSDSVRWKRNMYNLFSYHREPGKDRVDLWKTVNQDVRKTIGLQMLSSHIYGTQGTIFKNGQEYLDDVRLVLYGDRLVAASDLLKQFSGDSLTKVGFNNSQRLKWFDGYKKGGDKEQKKANAEIWKNGRSNIEDVYDAEKKIGKLSLTYSRKIIFD